MTALAHFHGTPDESLALLNAINFHCSCDFDPECGLRTSTCPSHHALATDQRWLDGLLFARRMATRIDAEKLGR